MHIVAIVEDVQDTKIDQCGCLLANYGFVEYRGKLRELRQGAQIK